MKIVSQLLLQLLHLFFNYMLPQKHKLCNLDLVYRLIVYNEKTQLWTFCKNTIYI